MLPVTILLMFIIVYIPTLLITMLFIRSGENVMKNTPRKRSFVVKQREVNRFQSYLFARSGYVALSVACIGWLASAGSGEWDEIDITKHMNIEVWAHRLGSWESNLQSGSFTDSTLSKYYHVQDVMSCQMLLGLVAQLVTMLERGQELKDIFEVLSESLFALNVIIISVVHAIFMIVRYEIECV